MAGLPKDFEKQAEEYLENTAICKQYVEGAKQILIKVPRKDFKDPNYQWSLNDFELGSGLECGRFGRAFVACEKHTLYIVTLKTLLKKELVEAGLEHQALREIEIQSSLKHPNILEMLTHFHDDLRIYVVSEFVSKELHKHLKQSPGGHFDEHLSAKYIYQVANALNYCHQQDVIHRDVKPENLLLSIHDEIKLADFGWAVYTRSLLCDFPCGTADYSAPEIVEGIPYGKYVDNWSLGVVCYEFLVGRPPFSSKTEDRIYKRIRQGDIKFPSHLSASAIDLISKLLRRINENRITLEEAMQHPWVEYFLQYR